MSDDVEIPPEESQEQEESEVADEVTIIFSDSGLEFQRDVVVGSSSSDVYAVMPTGSTAFFEVKLWQPTPENVERASNLASYYLTASGVDNAFIVMPTLDQSRPEIGLVTLADLGDVVATWLSKEPRKQEGEAPAISKKPINKIFAAVPFEAKYDDTYVIAMEPACNDVNAECIRVDREAFSGDIVEYIKRSIGTSIALIGDLSESNPNVLYEVGYAQGQDLPVVQICCTSLDNLPFDVRNNRTLPYVIGQTNKLRVELSEALHAELQG